VQIFEPEYFEMRFQNFGVLPVTQNRALLPQPFTGEKHDPA
jgi:hypothetical protein